MISKLYLIGGAAILSALILAGAATMSYKAGRDAEKAAQLKVIAKHQEREAKLVREIEKARAERKVEVREVVKLVRTSADPTGCLETKLSDVIPDSLLSSSPSH